MPIAGRIRWSANASDRKVSQPKPAIAINAPAIPGRKSPCKSGSQSEGNRNQRIQGGGFGWGQMKQPKNANDEPAQAEERREQGDAPVHGLEYVIKQQRHTGILANLRKQHLREGQLCFLATNVRTVSAVS